MVYSDYTKLRILYLHGNGYRPPTIKKHLDSEGIAVSQRGVANFWKDFLAEELSLSYQVVAEGSK